MEKYIGKVLNDRYMITEVVGVGGMAYVFKAFDKVCNRVVAVKILKDEFMSDTQFRRRFTNESKAITMLSQNNIVDVYDVSLEGDALYIVMEYIDGITLKEYMERKGALSPNEALHFIKQILQGVAHAHERGIVHRDIKPHNIMLLKDGTIKITDFGIARLTKFDTQTISDMTIGSVHYISPEQASGDRTDARSDIYSVGIILYEMLTGKLPFEADTAVAVALKQVQAQPELPCDLNPELPQGLEDITLKAMMKDPAIRYQSAGAFLADIALFEQDPTITFHYAAAPEETAHYTDDNSPTIFADTPLTEADFPEDAPAENEINGETEAPSEVDEDGKPASKFKNSWLPIIAGIGTAVLVMIVVALGIVFQKELFGDKLVACPGVVGKDLETVKKEYNFTFTVESTVASSEYAMGEIVSQDPVEGTKVKKKSKISVVVSSGPEGSGSSNQGSTEPTSVLVPDVLKKSKSDAVDEFKKLNISYRIESRYSDDIAEGYVISTNPSAGEEVSASSEVVIYISSGPEESKEPEVVTPVTVSVPDLSNMTKSAAETTLANNKLSLGSVTEEYSDTVEAGKVMRQSVAKKTRVEEGTTVDIVISLGKKPSESEQQPDPEQSTYVSYRLDLSAYAEKGSVEVAAKTQDGNSAVYGPSELMVSDYAANNYKVLLDFGEHPVGTVIIITVDGTTVDTVTAQA